MQVRIKHSPLYAALLLVSLLACQHAKAHPMPSSLVNLYVMESSIKGEARIPLVELENAIGKQDYGNINNTFFRNYFMQHITAVSDGKTWATVIGNMSLVQGTDSIVGGYRELVVDFELKPGNLANLRYFSFRYDAVMHQVITHKTMVYVQDWHNGIQEENSAKQVGIIGLDIPTGKIDPLEISLGKGSWWKGFASMFNLGMQHIKEGTDHLLFLLVLLLPSMLLVNDKGWTIFGGGRYSAINLFRIVTAFTLGHSITLLLGALGWVRLPSQPVEILIAISILISAIHAIRPVFAGRETYIAGGFGLVHGMAFATVLANLKLTAGTMALSILGFNLGIEAMQLIVIVLVVPWLILLSQTRFYRPIRIVGALLSAIAALGWIAERTAGRQNFVSKAIVNISGFALLGIGVLAAVSLLLFLGTKKQPANGYRKRQ